jgi:hypothetical protein
VPLTFPKSSIKLILLTKIVKVLNIKFLTTENRAKRSQSQVEPAFSYLSPFNVQHKKQDGLFCTQTK